MARGPRHYKIDAIVEKMEEFIDLQISNSPSGRTSLTVDLSRFSDYRSNVEAHNRLAQLYRSAGWKSVSVRTFVGQPGLTQECFEIILEA